jgi:MFS family permease
VNPPPLPPEPPDGPASDPADATGGPVAAGAPGRGVASSDRRTFRRLVYPLAATVGVGFGAILYGFSVLLTSGGAGGRFSGALLSGAFSGSVLAAAAVAIPIGRHADGHGIRGILALGGALVGGGFALFSLARQPWQVLAVWWLLIGPGSAMVLFDPAFVALEQWFQPAARNRAAGTLTLVTGLAGPVFVPATTVSVQSIGWRPTAAVLGALVAGVAWLTAGIALRVAPPPAGTITDPGTTTDPFVNQTAPRAASRIRARLAGKHVPPGFVVLTAAIVCGTAAMDAVQVHRLARFEVLGFDPVTLAFWAAVASVLSLPGRFLLPRLADRFASARLLLLVTALLVPALALTIRGTATWEMIGHFVVFGLAFGAAIPLRTVVMGDAFGGPRFGTLMGIQAAATAVGRAAGPGVVGWIGGDVRGYAIAMALVTATVVLSAVLLVGVVRTGDR